MNFWPDISRNPKMSDHQRANCMLAMRSHIGILGGSPGVGKTFCLAQIARAIIDDHGLDSICIACPTGKASVRITESLLQNEIDLRSRTIHSILKIGTREASEFNKTNPLPFRFVLLDESSMIDTTLAALMMNACSASCHILWTGDVHQLPPVGHGAPLRDLIAAGVAYGELTKIERNSGGIVEACAAIRDGRQWGAGDNLHLVETRTDHLAKVEDIYRQAREQGLDPIRDVQIVTAVNEKSVLSRKLLNVALQRMLNSRPGIQGVEFREGDKVVNNTNGFFKSAMTGVGFGDMDISSGDMDTNDRDEIYVANGELGRVANVERTSMVVELESPVRRIQVYFGEGGCTWELGYALSVHKSQGSDWPWVVVMLDDYPGARMVCDRSWLYTSISRAKDKCWLVGQKSVADRMCRTSKTWHRKTFLRELILRESAAGLLLAC